MYIFSLGVILFEFVVCINLLKTMKGLKTNTVLNIISEGGKLILIEYGTFWDLVLSPKVPLV